MDQHRVPKPRAAQVERCHRAAALRRQGLDYSTIGQRLGLSKHRARQLAMQGEALAAEGGKAASS